MTHTLDDRLGFGPHQSATIRQVIDDDPDYIEWAFNTIDGFELDDEAMHYLAQRYWHDHQSQKASF